MKNLLFVIFLLSVVGIVFYSCAKYKDSSPVTLHLTRPYCNDPNAENYNDSFPGRADDSVCIYPSDEFAGVYIFHDSIYNDSNLFIAYDSLVLRIYAVSDSLISVWGFCRDTNFRDTLVVQKSLIAYVDSNIGDSLTFSIGQALYLLSGGRDTLTGTMTKDAVDTSILHISFTVVSDTGSTNMHLGTAYKQ